MKSLLMYGAFLFIGLPTIMLTAHLATLSETEKQGLTEAAKDMKGRIYRVRIDCGRTGNDHVMRVHGRSRDDARRKIEARLSNCNVEMLEGESAPIWQEAIRSAY